MTGTIYVLRNRNNGKCYVGQTRNRAERFAHYKISNKKKRLTYIEAAIRKYGWDGFEVLTYDGIPEGLLDHAERGMISAISTLKPKGYNLESGGSKLKRQHPESNKKRSEAVSGEKHALYGTHLTEAQKKHISNKLTGRTFSDSHRLHLSLASRGVQKSESHKAKCRVASLGKNRGAANHMAKSVRCIETGEVFGSMADACRKHNLHSGHLSYCCKGKLKTHRGYHWEYAEAS